MNDLNYTSLYDENKDKKYCYIMFDYIDNNGRFEYGEPKRKFFRINTNDVVYFITNNIIGIFKEKKEIEGIELLNEIEITDNMSEEFKIVVRLINECIEKGSFIIGLYGVYSDELISTSPKKLENIFFKEFAKLYLNGYKDLKQLRIFGSISNG